MIEGQVTELTHAGDRSTADQNRYFLECVRDRRPLGPPACDLREAVITMELIKQLFG